MNNLPNALTVLFVGLKLTGHIEWSWFLILLPFIVSTLIATLIAVAKS